MTDDLRVVRGERAADEQAEVPEAAHPAAPARGLGGVAVGAAIRVVDEVGEAGLDATRPGGAALRDLRPLAELTRADGIGAATLEVEEERVIFFGDAVVHRLVAAELARVAARDVVHERVQREIERAVRHQAADERELLVRGERGCAMRGADVRGDEASGLDRVHAIRPRLVDGGRAEAVADGLDHHVPVVGQVVDDGAEPGVGRLVSAGLP